MKGEYMRFFLDSANIEEIQAAWDMGIICGVTTNPSIIAKSGRDFKEVLQEISTIVDGPINGEIKATTQVAKEMVREGRRIAAMHPNMVVKIPATMEGLQACNILSTQGIKVNITLIFTPVQALMAARAGATYVSPFVGRLDDIASDGLQVIKDIVTIFQVHGISTQIIAASIRTLHHVIACATVGANIATIPYAIIEEAMHHPLTVQGIEKFQKDSNESLVKI